MHLGRIFFRPRSTATETRLILEPRYEKQGTQVRAPDVNKRRNFAQVMKFKSFGPSRSPYKYKTNNSKVHMLFWRELEIEALTKQQSIIQVSLSIFCNFFL